MKSSSHSTEPPSDDGSSPSTTHGGGPPVIRRSALPSAFFLPAAPGYEGLELVGEGGMGVVYRARDARLKRLVAVKMLKAGTLTSERLARFRTEAEALARLAHPHIVPVFTWDERGPFLVLEYVPGGTLDQRLNKGPLEFDEAARLVAVLARAAQAAHDAGVVHRDLKPANVLMAPPVEGNSGTVCGGFPKVSDFGLAQLVDLGPGVTRSGILLGTPAYMAPEQATGNVAQTGPPCDVWALGVILYKALTGRLPFLSADPDDQLRQIINHPPKPPRAARRGVPAGLESACLARLKKDPRARPTAAGLALRLERYLLQNASTAQLSPAAPGRARRALSRVALAGLLAVALGGLLGLLATLLPRRPAGPAGSLKVASLRVVAARGGVIGETVNEARVGDKVRVEAELSGAGYAYLIALGCDGEERLLLATGEVTSIRYPAGDGWYKLDQDEHGGMQAFAIVAATRPLPPFEEWRRRRGPADWKQMPPAKDAFDLEDRPRMLGPGAAGKKGPPGPLMGALDKMGRSMRGTPDEAFRALVFPVRPEDD